MLKLIHPFKIYKTTYDVSSQLVADLYNCKEADEALRKTNSNSWHSKTFYNNSYMWAQDTITTLENIVNQTWSEICFGHGWFNVNGMGIGNEWHHHGDLPMVGVFYVNVPRNSSGAIEFRLDKDTCVYRPSTGDFIVFPGNLEHRVVENSSKEHRISMVLNFNNV